MTQPPPPIHYRQEVIRLRAKLVDLISRHSMAATIPLDPDTQMWQVTQVRDVLNDSSWEVAGFDGDWVWFKRFVEGKYIGT